MDHGVHFPWVYFPSPPPLSLFLLRSDSLYFPGGWKTSEDDDSNEDSGLGCRPLMNPHIFRPPDPLTLLQLFWVL